MNINIYNAFKNPFYKLCKHITYKPTDGSESHDKLKHTISRNIKIDA